MRYTKRAQVRTAAALFIEDRDAAKIAKALGVVERTVYALLKREDFNAELDRHSATLDRETFARNPNANAVEIRKGIRPATAPNVRRQSCFTNQSTTFRNTNALAVLLKR